METGTCDARYTLDLLTCVTCRENHTARTRGRPPEDSRQISAASESSKCEYHSEKTATFDQKVRAKNADHIRVRIIMDHCAGLSVLA